MSKIIKDYPSMNGFCLRRKEMKHYFVSFIFGAENTSKNYYGNTFIETSHKYFIISEISDVIMRHLSNLKIKHLTILNYHEVDEATYKANHAVRFTAIGHEALSKVKEANDMVEVGEEVKEDARA